MAQRMLNVTAHWDHEAQVFYPGGDVIGLRIGAATIEALNAKVLAAIADLVELNGIASNLAGAF